MATKDNYCLSLKSDNQHFVSSNQNGHQYSNLNLNSNQKCSSILETFQSNKSISTSSNSKNNDYASTIKEFDQIDFGKNQNQNKLSFWNKNGDGRNNFSNDSNIFGSTETSKEWKNNHSNSKKSSSSSNNSTLSIHITAYENSVEAQNESNSSAAKNDGTNLSKRKINKVLKVLKTGFAAMDAFEIPRQQTTETGTNKPEIMGFKASQKLQNSNQSSSTMDGNKVALPKTDRAKIIEEYEKKIDEFVKVPDNLEDIVYKIYSRELIQLLREIQKNLHIVPCPISDAELKRIGIDRIGMPEEVLPIISGCAIIEASSRNPQPLRLPSAFSSSKISEALNDGNKKAESIEVKPPPVSSLDTTVFSILGQQKIFVKVCIDKNQVHVIRNDFDEVISFKEVLPNIFEKANLSSKEFVIQSITVFDRKALAYVPVSDDYLIQPFDKFELYLVKKIQETEMFIQESGTQEPQKLSIDTSKIKNIKDLSKFLSEKLDIKEERISFVKFDEDFGGNITVNDEEKFDPTNVYNSQVTKIMKFSGVVRPRLTVSSNNSTDQPNGSTKQWGANNASANTNASSPSNKGGPPRVIIARQSADLRQNANDARKSTYQKDVKTLIAPTPKFDSRFDSAAPPPNDFSFSHSQTYTSEDKFNKAVFKTRFKERLQSYFNGVNIYKVVKSIIKLNNELNNPILFFEQIFLYCCETLKLAEAKERHTVSTLVVKCYHQDPGLKHAFAPAFKKYSKYLIENDIEGDVPHLKTTFPEFVARLMTDSKSLPNNEFIEGFKEFHESENYMFARTLAEFGRILNSRSEPDISGPLLWLFEEFANADPHYKSDEMKQIFARQPIDYENHKNLKELLSFD